MEVSVTDHHLKENLDYYELSVKDGYEMNLETKLFGDTIRLPLGISSIVLDGALRINKELEIAKGAQEFNTIMIVNCCAFQVAEEIASKQPNLVKWLEIYIFKDRTVTLDLVKRAEELKFKAIVLTIEILPKLSKKIMPILFENFRNIYKISSNTNDCDNSEIERLFNFADDVTWDDLEWLRSQTRLPIIVKGISTAEHARLAVYNGANAVMVSNRFGETNLKDSFEVLEEIVAEVSKQAYVFVDSDMITGSELFKALTVGVNAVFIRQPIICGVYHNGSEGVKSILDIYYRKLSAEMKSYGCSTVNDINRAYIRDIHNYINKSICSHKKISKL